MALTVRSRTLSARLGDDGGIAELTFAGGTSWSVEGRTVLGGALVSTASPPVALGGGAARWSWTCADESGHTAVVEERLEPAADGLRWTVAVTTGGPSFSAEIRTELGSVGAGGRSFWTTWGVHPSAGPNFDRLAWTDPLRPAPFDDLELPYGGEAVKGLNGFSVPIATVLAPADDVALSLVQSPADMLFDLGMTTTAGGDLAFGRTHHRIGSDRPVTFTMDLVASPADWRPGLAWMVANHPAFFEPVLEKTYELDGAGTYAFFPGPFGDELREHLDAIDYAVNWELSLRGPYMGLFVPPTGTDDEEWPSFLRATRSEAPPTESMRSWRDILRTWEDAGYHNLAYFNTTEFGAGIADPPPAPEYAADDPERWRSPNDHLYHDFPGAALRDADGKLHLSWEGAIGMDSGDRAFQDHVVAQAERLMTDLPAYAGLNIDRLDWLMRYNTHADDGLAWSDGQPARSLVTSWKQTAARLAEALHSKGKLLWVSPTAGKRLDWMRDLDGYFSEFNAGDFALNLDAFLGLCRPVIGWNNDLGDDPDSFLQSYLYLGVNPMSYTPLNDHGIGFSEDYARWYRDYGPLFRALRGKRWVLTPHVVEVEGDAALANVFTVPGGVAVSVVGGAGESVNLALRGIELDESAAEVLHPGSPDVVAVPAEWDGEVVRVAVPLLRGAALLRFGGEMVELGSRRINVRSLDPTTPAVVTATIDGASGVEVEVPRGWSATAVDEASWQVTAPHDGAVGEVRVTATRGCARVSDACRLLAGTALGEVTVPAGDSLPYAVDLDLGARRDVVGLAYRPRQDGHLAGWARDVVVSVSDDGHSWTQVAEGTFGFDAGWQTLLLDAAARRVRLEIRSAISDVVGVATVVVLGP